MKRSNVFSLALSSVLTIAFMIVSPSVFAAKNKEKNDIKSPEPKIIQYRLVYAKNSPMTDLSLNNAEIKVHLYSNGVPKGQQVFKTNEQGEFEFNQPKHVHSRAISMNLIRLQNDAKNNETCEGFLVHGKNELKVTCQKKHSRKASKNS